MITEKKQSLRGQSLKMSKRECRRWSTRFGHQLGPWRKTARHTREATCKKCGQVWFIRVLPDGWSEQGGRDGVKPCPNSETHHAWLRQMQAITTGGAR